MKTLISCFIIVLLTLSKISLAQDTIIMNNGDIILAKINEISVNEIRFKKSGFIEGPNYVESKSDISVIKFATGLRQTFTAEPPKADYYKVQQTGNKINILGHAYIQNGKTCPERHLYSTLLNTNNRKIQSLVAESKKAKGMQYIGFAAIPLGIIGVYTIASGNSGLASSSDRNLSNTIGAACIISAIACPIASGIFKHQRHERLNAAIKLYNETL
jgi:hypothetical protein